MLVANQVYRPLSKENTHKYKQYIQIRGVIISPSMMLIYDFAQQLRANQTTVNTFHQQAYIL